MGHRYTHVTHRFTDIQVRIRHIYRYIGTSYIAHAFTVMQVQVTGKFTDTEVQDTDRVTEI